MDSAYLYSLGQVQILGLINTDPAKWGWKTTFLKIVPILRVKLLAGKISISAGEIPLKPTENQS